MSRPHNAAIYAATILLLTTMVSGVLLVVVLPNYAAMFKELHGELPLPTKVLIALGTVPPIWRLYLVAAGPLVAFAIFVLVRIRNR